HLSGEVRVYDDATLRVRGTARLFQGGWYMLLDAYVQVVNDLHISIYGTCWRYAAGSLDVEGSIFNDGDLNNEGEINIGRP
ncbi:MAG TPA: hypothetical protein DIS79_06410, partial [Bacteroidetes bacterium]|nr:hypothetical protein [Bacteroidota bacterium]